MAFVSPTGIANMAVSHVGALATIENLITGKSPEAVQCRVWYEYSRQLILSMADWHFARARIGLALHGDVISETSTDPMAGVWGFRYQYPDDCLAARKIQNPNAPPDDASPFDVELSLNKQEKTILTDVEDAVLVYTFDQEATELFTPMFVLAHSHLLASLISWSLTGKRKVGTDQFALYQNVVVSAASTDANEGVLKKPREAEVVRDGFGSA